MISIDSLERRIRLLENAFRSTVCSNKYNSHNIYRVPDSAFADVANPTLAEAEIWGNNNISENVRKTGANLWFGGSEGNPQYLWYYNINHNDDIVLTEITNPNMDGNLYTTNGTIPNGSNRTIINSTEGLKIVDQNYPNNEIRFLSDYDTDSKVGINFTNFEEGAEGYIGMVEEKMKITSEILSIENDNFNFENGNYFDKNSSKKGLKLQGFGESNSDDTAGTADYSTLVNTSLVPKKYVDDKIFEGVTEFQQIEDGFNGIGFIKKQPDGDYGVITYTDDFYSSIYNYYEGAYFSLSQIDVTKSYVYIKHSRDAIYTSIALTDMYNHLETNLSKGFQLLGFGESDYDDTAGTADYSTLVNTSLVPKKYVDDNIINLYNSNGTISNGSNRTIINSTEGLKIVDQNYPNNEIRFLSDYDSDFQLPNGAVISNGIYIKDPEAEGFETFIGNIENGSTLYSNNNIIITSQTHTKFKKVGSNGYIGLFPSFGNSIPSNDVMENNSIISNNVIFNYINFANLGYIGIDGGDRLVLDGVFLLNNEVTSFDGQYIGDKREGNNKTGLVLLGFGESDYDDTAGTADYSTLVNTSLVPKKYVDDNAGAKEINDLSDGKSDGSSVFLGVDAGLNDTGGSGRNVGLGYQSLYSNTTGLFNVAIGTYSLYSNTEGIGNTAIGYKALYSNLTTSSNVAIGRYSLFSNNIGYSNLAVGDYSLYSNTEGIGNTAIGLSSLYNNTTGNNNSTLGYQAAYNTTGNNNSILGYQAARSQTSGDNNVVLGYQAAYFQTTGNNNVALGYQAAFYQTTGSNNIALGYQAAHSQLSGDNNITIGYNIDLDDLNGSYQLNIGNIIKGDMTSGSETVSIEGVLKLKPLSSAPASPTNGTMFYADFTDATFTSKGLWMYEEGSWVKK